MIAAYPAVVGIALIGVHHVFFVLAIFVCFVLASAHYSFAYGWSHAFNVILLAAFPLLFVDTCRFKPSLESSKNARKVALLSSLFLVSYMFGNAAFWKAIAGDFPMAWGSLENIKNHIVVQWSALGEDFPWLVKLFFSYDYGPLALSIGNLLMQASSIIGFLLILKARRPGLLWLAAVPIAGEILGLSTTMGMSILHLLPLVVGFLVPYKSDLTTWSWPTTLRHRIVIGACLSIVLVEVGFSFQRPFYAWAYPFTSYPMYSDIKEFSNDPAYSFYLLQNAYSIVDETIPADNRAELEHKLSLNFSRSFLDQSGRTRIEAELPKFKNTLSMWLINSTLNHDTVKTLSPKPAISARWRMVGLKTWSGGIKDSHPSAFIEPIIEAVYFEADSSGRVKSFAREPVAVGPNKFCVSYSAQELTSISSVVRMPFAASSVGFAPLATEEVEILRHAGEEKICMKQSDTNGGFYFVIDDYGTKWFSTLVYGP